MWQQINFVWPRSTQGGACTKLCCTSLGFCDTRKLSGGSFQDGHGPSVYCFWGFQGFLGFFFLASPGSLANGLKDEEEESFLPC